MCETECKDIKVYADTFNAYLLLILYNACLPFSYIDIECNLHIK